MELENSTFSSEIGPLLYLSRLTGLSMDVVVNWFILVLVSVFDPLAVSLVVAANHLKHKEKEKQIPPEDDNSPPPPKKEKVTKDVLDVTIPLNEIKIKDVVFNKKPKIKKEKKPLAITDESVILEQNEIERAFYEEQPRPDLGYRRGVSL